MAVAGKSIPHDSAKGHVTGSAEFLDDRDFESRELQVGFFYSPVAHGEIISLNYEAALALEGVAGIYSYRDIPGTNILGAIIADENLLVEKRCEFVGQPILIIAAETKDILDRAKDKILLEVKELEPVLTINQAIEKQQFISDTSSIEMGDFQLAFEQSSHKLTGTFHNNGQEHFYLEPQSAVAYPDEGVGLRIHSSTQNTTEIQDMVAKILRLGEHQVVVTCKRMGGAFGGKESQAAVPAMMAALVAWKTGRAARIIYPREDDMRSTGKRHPYMSRYQVGFDNQGKIEACKIEFFSNGGAGADLSTSIMDRTLKHAENAYFIPNMEVTGTVCRTNLAPNTAYRGFGGPQGMIVIENIVQEIAITLKKDAFEVRDLNCYGVNERNKTPYGQVVEANMLPEILTRLHKSSNYQNRLAEIEIFNQKSKTKLRGIALTPVKFGISFTTKFLNQGNALVNIYRDGTVQVSTGGTEMGQGLYTKIGQLVADEFGLDICNVRVMPTSTEKNNNTSPTAASTGTDLNGMAAVVASKKILSRLSEFAVKFLSETSEGTLSKLENISFEGGEVFDRSNPDKRVTFKELVIAAFLKRVDLGARGFYKTPGIGEDPQKGLHKPFFYFTQGAAVSEVEIDRFTGELKVTQADILMDIGKSINPGIDRGQVIGAYIQGMGWVTSEELCYTRKGELLTLSPTTYKIPGIHDLPDSISVEFIDNPGHIVNVRSSKATGEPPFLLCLSVWIAVKHALSSISGGQIPELTLPATGEEILNRITEVTTGKGFKGESCELNLVGNP